MGNHAARGKSMPGGVRFAFVVHCVADCVFKRSPDGRSGWLSAAPRMDHGRSHRRAHRGRCPLRHRDRVVSSGATPAWNGSQTCSTSIIWSLCASAGIALSSSGGPGPPGMGMDPAPRLHRVQWNMGLLSVEDQVSGTMMSGHHYLEQDGSLWPGSQTHRVRCPRFAT